jgi:hypothetical protein
MRRLLSLIFPRHWAASRLGYGFEFGVMGSLVDERGHGTGRTAPAGEVEEDEWPFDPAPDVMCLLCSMTLLYE